MALIEFVSDVLELNYIRLKLYSIIIPNIEVPAEKERSIVLENRHHLSQ